MNDLNAESVKEFALSGREIVKSNINNYKYDIKADVIDKSIPKLSKRCIFSWTYCYISPYANDNEFKYKIKPCVFEVNGTDKSISDKNAISNKLTNIKTNNDEFKKIVYSRSYQDLGSALIKYFKKRKNEEDFKDFIASNKNAFITLKNPSQGNIMTLLNIGEILSKNSEENSNIIELAIDYYQKSLPLINPERHPNECAMIMICLGDLYFKLSGTNGHNYLDNALCNYAEAIRLIDPNANYQYFSVVAKNFESICRLMVQGDSSINFPKIIQFLRDDEIFKLIKRATKIDLPDKCKINDRITASIQILVNREITIGLKNLAELLAHENQKTLEVIVAVTATGFKVNKSWCRMKVPISGDSNRVSFILSPNAPGKGLIEFEIFYNSARIGYMHSRMEIYQD